VIRRFRDGHAETWWAADAQLGGWGPDRPLRLMVATTDPANLPGHSSWYLLTNLPRPTSGRAQQADLANIVALRNWVEQGYKQVKGELGWADFQVRSDRAIRRHWMLVCCAFSFCWQAFLAEQPAAPESQIAAASTARGAPAAGHPRRTSRRDFVAGGGTGGSRPGWPHGACCSAAGGHGRQRHRPGSCKGCLTSLPQVGLSISTCRHSQQTTDRSRCGLAGSAEASRSAHAPVMAHGHANRICIESVARRRDP
jgi:hypothetical protein